MALSDAQQDEIYAWVRDTQLRVRGTAPDADMLQVINQHTADTQLRVRGVDPEMDMLQAILGEVSDPAVDPCAEKSTAAALVTPAWVAGIFLGLIGLVEVVRFIVDLII